MSFEPSAAYHYTMNYYIDHDCLVGVDSDHSDPHCDCLHHPPIALAGFVAMIITYVLPLAALIARTPRRLILARRGVR